MTTPLKRPIAPSNGSPNAPIMIIVKVQRGFPPHFLVRIVFGGYVAQLYTRSHHSAYLIPAACQLGTSLHELTYQVLSFLVEL